MPETQRDTKIRALLQSIVDAYDAGCVQLSSQDIQFDDENPPHPWHEEWLSDVRTTLDLQEAIEDMTPREKIAKLAAMSPEEFNQFMLWNFNRVCNETSLNNET